MNMFPEDDDLDLERELEDVERNMERSQADYRVMGSRSHSIRKELKRKQLEPLVAKAIELARDTGHAIGANEALGSKLKNLNKRIVVRDEELKRTADRDEWKQRALVAEETIERSKKRKRR